MVTPDGRTTTKTARNTGEPLKIDLEVVKDRLGKRLQREVKVYQAASA